MDALRRGIQDDRDRILQLQPYERAQFRSKYRANIQRYSAKLIEMYNAGPQQVIPDLTSLDTVGAYGEGKLLYAKVIQVIDENNVLVGTENVHTEHHGEGKTFREWIMLHYTTKGLIDDRDVGDLTAFRGPRQFFLVSKTVKYKTAGGATKTVPYVEVLNCDAPYKPPK